MKLPAFAMAFLATGAFAAQPAATSSSPAVDDQAAVSSQAFVAQAAMAALFEIQAGILAQSQGVDARVKDFGHRMVMDHTAAHTQLQQAVGSNTMLPAKLDAGHQEKLDKLRALQGQAFDVAYSDDMMKGHEQAVALFTRASTSLQVGPDLQAYARTTLPTLQQHRMLSMGLPGSAR
jgi:putative membrane protein